MEAAISVEFIILPTFAFTVVIIPDMGDITCLSLILAYTSCRLARACLIWASYTAVSVWRCADVIACKAFSACFKSALSETMSCFEDKTLFKAVLMFALWVSKEVLSAVETL